MERRGGKKSLLSATKAFTLCRVAEIGGLIASFISPCQLEFGTHCNVVEVDKEIYYCVSSVYNFFMIKILLLVWQLISVMCNVFEKTKLQTGSFSEIRVTS